MGAVRVRMCACVCAFVRVCVCVCVGVCVYHMVWLLCACICVCHCSVRAYVCANVCVTKENIYADTKLRMPAEVPQVAASSFGAPASRRRAPTDKGQSSICQTTPYYTHTHTHTRNNEKAHHLSVCVDV